MFLKILKFLNIYFKKEIFIIFIFKIKSALKNQTYILFVYLYKHYKIYIYIFTVIFC